MRRKRAKIEELNKMKKSRAAPGKTKRETRPTR